MRHEEDAVFTAWLIVYPYTGDFSWEPLLQTVERTSVASTYESLIQTLRIKVTAAMGQWMNKIPSTQEQLTDDLQNTRTSLIWRCSHAALCSQPDEVLLEGGMCSA
jgi:hypothetical protein